MYTVRVNFKDGNYETIQGVESYEEREGLFWVHGEVTYDKSKTTDIDYVAHQLSFAWPIEDIKNIRAEYKVNKA